MRLKFEQMSVVKGWNGSKSRCVFRSLRISCRLRLRSDSSCVQDLHPTDTADAKLRTDFPRHSALVGYSEFGELKDLLLGPQQILDSICRSGLIHRRSRMEETSMFWYTHFPVFKSLADTAY